MHFNKIKNLFYRFDNWSKNVFNTFTSFLRTNWGLILIGLIITVIAVLIRLSMFDYLNGDSYWFLNSWVKFYRDNGGILAIGKLPISQIKLGDLSFIPYWKIEDLSIYDPSQYVYCDYLVGYMTFVCLLSIFPVPLIYVTKILATITDIAMAIGVLLIVYKVTKDKKRSLLSFAITLFLPTTVLNAGMWGQADGFYTCIIVYSVYFMICDKSKTSLLFYGLALGFKLQAIFILPLYGFLFLAKKMKLRHLLMIPVGIFATMIPFILGSGDFITPFKQYFGQIGNYPGANYYSGSMFVIFDGMDFSRYCNWLGIPLMLGLVILTLYLFFYKKIKPTPTTILAVAAFYSFLVPFTLPHMHERYFFLADIFIVIYVLCKKKKYHYGLLQQFSSINCYSHFLFGYYLIPVLDRGCMLFSLGINIYLIWNLFKEIWSSDHEKEEEKKELIIKDDENTLANELNNSK